MTVLGWKCDLRRNVKTNEASHSLQTFSITETLQASWGILEMAFLILHKGGSFVGDMLCLIHLSIRLTD